MDHKRIQSTLNSIAKIYRPILDDLSVSVVLPNAAAQVKVTKERYDTAKKRGDIPEPWGYAINHEQPLRFIASRMRGLDLQVDVYCDIGWRDDPAPVKQDIKVRIWSNHADIIYDPARDSQEILEKLSDPERAHQGRVVSRYHFDRVNRGDTEVEEYHPEYHLQVGGISYDYELCLHPKKVNIPRIICHPLELLLTYQMIAISFFWKEYQQFNQRPEWKQELILYQKLLLKDYYQRCINIINSNNSLLDELGVM